MLFDFDDQLFSSRPYTAMIRKTVKLSIRSPTRRAPGPEEVITQITGNSVVPKLPSPILKFVGKAQGRDNDQTQNSTKILLLGKLDSFSILSQWLNVMPGPGEASKTTFLKQMQWIYGPGFSSAERKTWCHAIRESFLESLDTFINLQDDNSAYNCTVSNSPDTCARSLHVLTQDYAGLEGPDVVDAEGGCFRDRGTHDSEGLKNTRRGDIKDRARCYIQL